MLETVVRQFLLGTALFAVTVLLEALCTVWVFEWRKRHVRRMVHLSPARAIAHVTLVMLALFGLHLFQMLLWAGVFVIGGAFDSAYRALFFSMSCFSTLGLANFLPPANWELVATTEGVVGSLMMGWSAGILFAAAHSLYLSVEHKSSEILG